MGGFKDGHLFASRSTGCFFFEKGDFVFVPLFDFENFLMDPSFDKYKKEQSSPTLCVVIVIPGFVLGTPRTGGRVY